MTKLISLLALLLLSACMQELKKPVEVQTAGIFEPVTLTLNGIPVIAHQLRDLGEYTRASSPRIIPLTIKNNSSYAISNVHVEFGNPLVTNYNYARTPEGAYVFPGFGGTCLWQIAPGATCTINLEFYATASGQFAQTIILNYQNLINSNSVEMPVTMYSGNPASLVFVPDETNYHFGNLVGLAQVPLVERAPDENGEVFYDSKVLTIKNAGELSARQISVNFSQACSSKATNTCPAGLNTAYTMTNINCPVTLAKDEECQVRIEFSPNNQEETLEHKEVAYTSTVNLSYKKDGEGNSAALNGYFNVVSANIEALFEPSLPTFVFDPLTVGNRDTRGFRIKNSGYREGILREILVYAAGNSLLYRCRKSDSSENLTSELDKYLICYDDEEKEVPLEVFPYRLVDKENCMDTAMSTTVANDAGCLFDIHFQPSVVHQKAQENLFYQFRIGYDSRWLDQEKLVPANPEAPTEQELVDFTVDGDFVSAARLLVTSLSVAGEVITPTKIYHAVAGQSFTLTRPTELDNSNSTIVSCNTVPALPSWASIDNTTCEITGTPVGETSSAIYRLNVTYQDASTREHPIALAVLSTENSTKAHLYEHNLGSIALQNPMFEKRIRLAMTIQNVGDTAASSVSFRDGSNTPLPLGVFTHLGGTTSSNAYFRQIRPDTSTCSIIPAGSACTIDIELFPLSRGNEAQEHGDMFDHFVANKSPDNFKAFIGSYEDGSLYTDNNISKTCDICNVDRREVHMRWKAILKNKGVLGDYEIIKFASDGSGGMRLAYPGETALNPNGFFNNAVAPESDYIIFRLRNIGTGPIPYIANNVCPTHRDCNNCQGTSIPTNPPSLGSYYFQSNTATKTNVCWRYNSDTTTWLPIKTMPDNRSDGIPCLGIPSDGIPHVSGYDVNQTRGCIKSDPNSTIKVVLDNDPDHGYNPVDYGATHDCARLIDWDGDYAPGEAISLPPAPASPTLQQQRDTACTLKFVVTPNSMLKRRDLPGDAVFTDEIGRLFLRNTTQVDELWEFADPRTTLRALDLVYYDYDIELSQPCKDDNSDGIPDEACDPALAATIYDSANPNHRFGLYTSSDVGLGVQLRALQANDNSTSASSGAKLIPSDISPIMSGVIYRPAFEKSALLRPDGTERFPASTIAKRWFYGTLNYPLQISPVSGDEINGSHGLSHPLNESDSFHMGHRSSLLDNAGLTCSDCDYTLHFGTFPTSKPQYLSFKLTNFGDIGAKLKALSLENKTGDGFAITFCPNTEAPCVNSELFDDLENNPLSISSYNGSEILHLTFTPDPDHTSNIALYEAQLVYSYEPGANTATFNLNDYEKVTFIINAIESGQRGNFIRLKFADDASDFASMNCSSDTTEESGVEYRDIHIQYHGPSNITAAQMVALINASDCKDYIKAESSGDNHSLTPITWLDYHDELLSGGRNLSPNEPNMRTVRLSLKAEAIKDAPRLAFSYELCPTLVPDPGYCAPNGDNNANQTFTPGGSDANLTFVAASTGSYGNSIHIKFVQSGSTLLCSRTDMNITITYPSSGVSANDIADAVANTIDCSLLVSASTSGDDIEQNYNSWHLLAGNLVNGSDGNSIELFDFGLVGNSEIINYKLDIVDNNKGPNTDPRTIIFERGAHDDPLSVDCSDEETISVTYPGLYPAEGVTASAMASALQTSGCDLTATATGDHAADTDVQWNEWPQMALDGRTFHKLESTKLNYSHAGWSKNPQHNVLLLDMVKQANITSSSHYKKRRLHIKNVSNSPLMNFAYGKRASVNGVKMESLPESGLTIPNNTCANVEQFTSDQSCLIDLKYAPTDFDNPVPSMYFTTRYSLQDHQYYNQNIAIALTPYTPGKMIACAGLNNCTNGGRLQIPNINGSSGSINQVHQVSFGTIVFNNNLITRTQTVTVANTSPDLRASFLLAWHDYMEAHTNSEAEQILGVDYTPSTRPPLSLHPTEAMFTTIDGIDYIDVFKNEYSPGQTRLNIKASKECFYGEKGFTDLDHDERGFKGGDVISGSPLPPAQCRMHFTFNIRANYIGKNITAAQSQWDDMQNVYARLRFWSFERSNMDEVRFFVSFKIDPEVTTLAAPGPKVFSDIEALSSLEVKFKFPEIKAPTSSVGEVVAYRIYYGESSSSVTFNSVFPASESYVTRNFANASGQAQSIVLTNADLSMQRNRTYYFRVVAIRENPDYTAGLFPGLSPGYYLADVDLPILRVVVPPNGMAYVHPNALVKSTYEVINGNEYFNYATARAACTSLPGQSFIDGSSKTRTYDLIDETMWNYVKTNPSYSAYSDYLSFPHWLKSNLVNIGTVFGGGGFPGYDPGAELQDFPSESMLYHRCTDGCAGARMVGGGHLWEPISDYISYHGETVEFAGARCYLNVAQ